MAIQGPGDVVAEEVVIRPARSGDIGPITTLFVELKRHHARLAPDSPRYKIPDVGWATVAAQAVEDDRYEVFVASAGSRIVGLVKLSYASKPWGTSCEVDTLVVTEQWRGRGIGSALMTAADDAARRAGAAGMRVAVLHSNDPAIGVYRALGYEVVAVRMGKAIEGPAGRE